jgi:hypothetical protein
MEQQKWLQRKLVWIRQESITGKIFSEIILHTRANTAIKHCRLENGFSLLRAESGYLVNPVYNFNVEIGIASREVKNNVFDNKAMMLTFGIRTAPVQQVLRLLVVNISLDIY